MIKIDHQVRPFYKSWTLRIGFLIAVIVFASHFFVTDKDELFGVIDAIIAAVAVGVIVGWTKAVFRSLTKHPWEFLSRDAMLIGIWLFAICSLVAFTLLWIFRVTDDIYWRNHVAALLSRVGFVIALSFMLATAGAVGGDLPPRAYVNAGIMTAIGLAIAVTIISLGLV